MSMWKQPPGTELPKLKLYNSFTKKKDVFVPQNRKLIKWYSCGPTVYDASHMGHARSYISFDILRRVLSDYFGYDVQYVMNITDIDDKIIKRARQNHLFQKFIGEDHSVDEIINIITDLIQRLAIVVKETTDHDKRQMQLRLVANITKALTDVENAMISNVADAVETSKVALLHEAKDLLSDWLDEKQGVEIHDHGIFDSLAKHWEEEYFKDMEALNVLQPNILTRVSEYIPEIVKYIEEIIKKGYAYESNRSVYFDVAKFADSKNHTYAKLVPEAFGDTKAIEEAEGSLSTTETNEKRSPNDFALWKASKPGEPLWSSIWGEGRPGWHIECSVMASAICGNNMDIHTGGYDLKFPHHDNELAQAEAYYDNDNWVNYFLHSGHLMIAGCKMSKSLKNFITIKDALKKHTSRQIRFVFLLHSWKDTLDYSDNTMDMALQYEKFVNEFLLTVKDLKWSISGLGLDKFSEEEMSLMNELCNVRQRIYDCLCDNVDTRGALEEIRELVCKSNIYIRNKRTNKGICNSQLLEDIANYIVKLFTVFGVKMDDSESSNQDPVLMPVLRAVADFRENIRKTARGMKAIEILSECDNLRDNVLPEFGVRLEDHEGQPPVVKLVDKETLLRERDQLRKQEEEKRLEKERKKEELGAIQALKDAQKKMPPSEMFLKDLDKYSKFTDKGLPTHDVDGKEISKGQLKKLQKLYQVQEKKYNEFIASQENSVNNHVGDA